MPRRKHATLAIPSELQSIPSAVGTVSLLQSVPTASYRLVHIHQGSLTGPLVRYRLDRATMDESGGIEWVPLEPTLEVEP